MRLSQAVLLLSSAHEVLGRSISQWTGLAQPSNDVEPLESQFYKDLGSKRVKITYGPYEVPGIDDPETSGMKQWVVEAAKPCNDCFIYSFKADLIFDDGTTANANTGMWLHHILFVNNQRNDLLCDQFPERVAAAGNERSPLDLTLGGTVKAGYPLDANDTLGAVIELMNASQDARNASVTIEWEYVPYSTADFKRITPVWLDIAGFCNFDVPVPANATVFEYISTPSATLNLTGDVIIPVAHLHDGGTHLEVIKNNQVVCDSTANYGESEGYVTHVGMFGHEHEKEEEEEHEHAPETPEHEHAPTPTTTATPEHEHAPGVPAHEHPPAVSTTAAPAHEHAPGVPAHEHPPAVTTTTAAPAHEHAPGVPAHEHPPAVTTTTAAPAHEHAPGTPPHEHPPATPSQSDPPATPEHSHAPGTPEHEHEETEPHEHNHDTDGHILSISSMTGCPVTKTVPGDQWHLKAYYNLTEHTAMAGHHGGLEPVMGIAIAYVITG